MRNFLFLAIVLLTESTMAFPVITQPPRSTNSPAGLDVTLNVVATGNPPIRYQWRRNGVNIPGANTDTLTLTSVTPTNAGSYRVVVVDADGAVTSPEAKVGVSAPQIPFSDFLANSFVDRDPPDTFFGKGNNLTATREPNEPLHAGKQGGKSVWYSWLSPGNGMMTVRTAGSSFDTLLAVYRGNSMTNLTLIAADDDSGPALSSEVTFFAPQADTVYHFVVDGVHGATGEVVLSWSFEDGFQAIPEFRVQPQSRTVPPGSNVVFSSDVVTPFGEPTYQWFFNRQPIPGAVERVYSISSVRPENVGTYEVLARVLTREVYSQPAQLEIGSNPEAITHDKLGELLFRLGRTPQRQSQSLPKKENFTSVSAGTPGTQVFDNFGSTTEGEEPNHASALGGSSRWFDLRAASSGVMEIDTIGSSIDTVLAVYTGNDLFSLTLVASDNNGAPDGIRSKVRFNAVAGTDYLVAVDGVDGAQGNISLNWQLGNLPTITQPPVPQTVNQGSNATFSVTVTGLPPALLQWRFNGTNLVLATNSILLITNVQSGQAGSYLVVASNFVGSITSAPVNLTVQLQPPVILAGPTNATKNEGENFQFSVSASGAGPLTYLWYRDGLLRQSGSLSTLSFSPVQSSDAGNYTVVVTNSAGAVTSSPPAVLQVRLRPTIVAGPPGRNVLVGGTAQFFVIVGGTPPFSYQWRFEGVPLANQTNSTLTLTGVQTNQAGPYSVVVTNAAGSVTSPPGVLIVRSGLRLAGGGAITASNGVFRFVIENGAPDTPIQIDVSTNLVTWEFLTTVYPPDTTVEVTDPIPPGRPRRFYRAREEQ